MRRRLFRDFQLFVIPIDNGNRRVSEAKRFVWLADGIVADVTVEWWHNGWTGFYDFIVSEEWRGKGIGTEIVKFLVEQIGANQINVDPDNERLINFYKRFGFEPTGEYDGEFLRMGRKDTD